MSSLLSKETGSIEQAAKDLIGRSLTEHGSTTAVTKPYVDQQSGTLSKQRR